MSTEQPIALVRELADTTIDARSSGSAWIETALAVLFTVIAVLLVSSLAVVTGLA
jgi:hypothetical protein